MSVLADDSFIEKMNYLLREIKNKIDHLICLEKQFTLERKKMLSKMYVFPFRYIQSHYFIIR